MDHLDRNGSASVSDEHIIAGIRSGSEDAFSLLFHAHYVDLVGYAESYLASHEEAEEVVCELFVRIYEIRQEWQPGTNLRAYLFRAVRNRVLNLIRNNKREAERSFRFTSEMYLESDSLLQDIHADLEDEEEDIKVRKVLEQAIASLPPRAREVVSLRWKEGMSDDMIAQIMDTTVAGVRMQASRALKVLKERLAGYLK